MRVEINLSHDEVNAAVLAYLRTKGLHVASADATHATGDLMTVTHNHEASGLTLHGVAEVKAGHSNTRDNVDDPRLSVTL